MTPVKPPRIADHMTRDQVAGRLTAWLGENRRAPIESLVDSFLTKFGPEGPEECEQALMWAVHIGQGHDTTDMDTAIHLAARLTDLGLDRDRFDDVHDLRCRECEQADINAS